MEHLIPMSLSSRLAGIRISALATPWLGCEHDGNPASPILPFDQYPIFRGWRVDELTALKKGDFGTRSEKSVLAMLQSWLFFGFLECCTQIRIPEAYFVEKVAEGSSVIKTTNLSLILQMIRERSKDQSQEKQEALVRELHQTLKLVHRWNTDMADEKSPLYIKLQGIPELHNIVRLHVLLSESVEHTVHSLQADLEPMPEDLTINARSRWKYTEIGRKELESQLHRQGWCKFTISILAWYRWSVAEYATILNSPPDLQEDKHSNCTSEDCIGYRVDPTNHQNQHVNPSCKCLHRTVPLERVTAVLLSGQIPVINLSSLLDSDKDPVHSVFEDENGRSTDYVAISHVWADGWGSVTEVGLLNCQLRFLQRIASARLTIPCIWIDSLCVPRVPTMRSIAVRVMAKTYRLATHTVVLDSQFMRIPYSISSPQELLIRFVASGWMQRLWTLQEGLLSKSLWLQFQDSQVQFEDLILRAQDSENNHFGDIICTSLVVEVWSLIKQQNLGALELADVQRILRFRRTSQEEDEAVAIAPLLGVNAGDIADVSPYAEERMCKFFSLLPRVPVSILFMDCPRLTKPGYRWAPRTLMIRDPGFLHLESPNSAISTPVWKNGLRINAFVFRFNEPFRHPGSPINVLVYDRNEGRLLTIAQSSKNKRELCFDCILPGDESSGKGSVATSIALLSVATPASEIEEFIYVDRVFMGDGGILASPKYLQPMSEFMGYDIPVVDVLTTTKELLIT